MAIGTQLLGPPPAHSIAEIAEISEPGYPWDERIPPPGRDATLLAVVPIPGTQTSLAIVGYAISTSAAPNQALNQAPDQEPDQALNQAPDQALNQAPDQEPDQAPDQALNQASGLLIDRVQRRVWADGAEITLTFQEFELLAFLSAHPAQVFSRADLLKHVWSDGPDRRDVRRDSRTVDVHVSRLRRKLGPVHGRCLVTEHRAGYQFRPPSP